MARSGDEVAAGDGLVAFGAVLILPVQKHCMMGRVAAGQWIYANKRHALNDRKADKQGRQIQHGMPNWPRSRARQPAASPQPHQRVRMPGHRSCGCSSMPATPTPAPERRAAATGRCTSRRSRGTLKDGRRRPEPCGVRSTWLRWTAEGPQCHCAPRGTPTSLEYAPGLFKETALPINKEHRARASSCLLHRAAALQAAARYREPF
jgi:hypothetical protein